MELENISTGLTYWSGSDMEALNKRMLQSRWFALDTARHFKTVNYNGRNYYKECSTEEEGAEPMAGDGQTEPGLGGSRHQLLGLQEEQGRTLRLGGQ